MEHKYYAKEPKDCSEKEMKTFKALVLKGEKVKEAGLSDRIKNCKLLGFCINEKDEVIAVSSIKRPVESYVKKIIDKAKINRSFVELEYELGYSYTEPAYRRQGLNSSLKMHLLDIMKTQNCLIFSTTAIPSSRRFLLDNGFVNCGISYDGDNDKNIQYFEIIYHINS